MRREEKGRSEEDGGVVLTNRRGEGERTCRRTVRRAVREEGSPSRECRKVWKRLVSS